MPLTSLKLIVFFFSTQIRRIGNQHQAGSDSLLTLSSFFRLKESLLKNTNNAKYENILFGIEGESDGYPELFSGVYMIPDMSAHMVMGGGYAMPPNVMMNARYFMPPSDNFMNNMDMSNYNYGMMFGGYPPMGGYPTESMTAGGKGKKFAGYGNAMGYVDSYDH